MAREPYFIGKYNNYLGIAIKLVLYILLNHLFASESVNNCQMSKTILIINININININSISAPPSSSSLYRRRHHHPNYHLHHNHSQHLGRHSTLSKLLPPPPTPPPPHTHTHTHTQPLPHQSRHHFPAIYPWQLFSWSSSSYLWSALCRRVSCVTDSRASYLPWSCLDSRYGQGSMLHFWVSSSLLQFGWPGGQVLVRTWDPPPQEALHSDQQDQVEQSAAGGRMMSDVNNNGG